MNTSRHLKAAVLAATLLAFAAPTAFAADQPGTTAGATSAAVAASQTLPEVNTDTFNQEVFQADRPVALLAVEPDCRLCDQIESRLVALSAKLPDVKFVKISDKNFGTAPFLQFRLPGRIGATVQLEPAQLTEEAISDTITARAHYAAVEWKLMKEIDVQEAARTAQRTQMLANSDTVGKEIEDSNRPFNEKIKGLEEKARQTAQPFDKLIADLQELKVETLAPIRQEQNDLGALRLQAEQQIRKKLNDHLRQYDREQDEASRKINVTKGTIDQVIGLDQEDAHRNGTK